MSLQVWARTPDLRRRGQLSVIEATAVLRDTEVGTWVLTVDGGTEIAAQFAEGWGVQVFEDGEYRFSGPAVEISYEHNGDGSVDLVLAGITDTHVLADRLTYPNAAQSAGAQTSAYHTRKGVTETLIAELININAGPGALTARRTRGLKSYTSKGRGPVSSINTRFAPVLNEVRTLAQVGGLVVDVQHRGLTAELEVVVRARVDRKRSVRFRPGTGLNKVEASLKAPTANAVLVAGGGEGAARVIREHNSAEAKWGGRRVEVFQDRRDTTDSDELLKAGTETLQEGEASARAVFGVSESDVYRFGQHFLLGDTVTLDLGDFQVSEPVRVVELKWDEYGRTVTLTVGDPLAEDDEITPAVEQQVKQLISAVNELKARR